jgi:hypothetical protein
MKQTTIQFEKRKQEPVTIQRLQEALDLINAGEKATYALRSKQLSSNWSIFFEKTLIIRRVSGHKVEVLKPVIERKDFYRLCDLRSKYEKKIRNKRSKLVTVYTPLPKADTDMLGLVNMPSNEPVKAKRSYNKRYPVIAKKAVALPWWKRFLLYLANH